MTDFEKFDYSVFDEKKAEYIYRESKEFLQNTIDAASEVQAKSFQLLGFLLTVASALVGFLMLKFEAFTTNNIEMKALCYTAVLMAASYAIGFLILARNLEPKEFFSTGNRPKNLLRGDFCKQAFHLMLLGECRNYEERIIRNIELNTANAKRLKLCANLAILTIIAAPFIAWIIFSLLQYYS